MDPTIPIILTTRTTPTLHRIIVGTLRPIIPTTAQREPLGGLAAAVMRVAAVGQPRATVEACPVCRICQQGTDLPLGRVVLLHQAVLQESQREEEVSLVFVVARRETQASAVGDRIAAQPEEAPMPVSPEPIHHRHVEIVLTAHLLPCVHTFHPHHPPQHRVHRPVAVDDLADLVDIVVRVDQVVGRGVAEVGSINRVA
ncbi:MAG TPA: hypothetical protein DGH68_01015 [Bacteroidetes bacterium]|nr:hypothetical protein [Bacteroidota bacterium]